MPPFALPHETAPISARFSSIISQNSQLIYTTSFNSLIPRLYQRTFSTDRLYSSSRLLISRLLPFALLSGATYITITSLGFGPAGIIAGSIAALSQCVAYGALTPAGSLFAGVTSMDILRTLGSVAAGISVGVETTVTGAFGVVRHMK
jgi:hypothetical protein